MKFVIRKVVLVIILSVMCFGVNEGKCVNNKYQELKMKYKNLHNKYVVLQNTNKQLENIVK